VPVRLLLVVLVLVPWSGFAYRTVDRIDHDRGELAFTEELAPAAVNVKLLAQIQRELEVEAAAADPRIPGTVANPTLEKDRANSRRRIDRLLDTLQISAPTTIRRSDLQLARAQFDTLGSGSASHRGYSDLLAANRAALNTSVRELWVLVAMLGGDQVMRDTLVGLELSMNATDASVRQSNLLLRQAVVTSPDRVVESLIADEQRSALRALRSIVELPLPVAQLAKEAINNTDEAAIAEATRRSTNPIPGKPQYSANESKQLDQLLNRRNARLGAISDNAATALSLRADRFIRDQRREISNTLWLLVASLVVALTIATLVGRWIWRPLRELGRHAVALVNGVDQVEPIRPQGPRELVTSAYALNDLTETLMAVQKQADALAAGPLEDAAHDAVQPNRLGSSVQLAVRRLSESIQLNNQLRDKFEYAANHDALTGLPNRSAVYRRLEQHLEAHELVAVLFVDLDHFKRANDTQGHLAGDEILRVMAARFAQSAGPNRMVARLGGDEFLIVCGGESLEAAVQLIDIIRTAASQPIDVGHASVTLGASAGAAVSQTGDTASSLLQRADKALYEAKTVGRNVRATSDSFA
jgi:diguanylate cyclase (GGDEF)-like protein